jgi:hypothetical protein
MPEIKRNFGVRVEQTVELGLLSERGTCGHRISPDRKRVTDGYTNKNGLRAKRFVSRPGCAPSTGHSHRE